MPPTECTDLTELGEGRDAHGPVRAARNHHVHIARLQGADRGLDGCHRARTGRIDREIGATEIEGIGDTSRDHIGQLAGHGVFIDGRQLALHALLKLSLDRSLVGRR